MTGQRIGCFPSSHACHQSKAETGHSFLNPIMYIGRIYQHAAAFLNTLHSSYLALQAAAHIASLIAVTQEPRHCLYVNKHMLLCAAILFTPHTQRCKLPCTCTL